MRLAVGKSTSEWESSADIRRCSYESRSRFVFRNLAPAGANTIYDNLCTTYSGAGPALCPNIIALSGR